MGLAPKPEPGGVRRRAEAQHGFSGSSAAIVLEEGVRALEEPGRGVLGRRCRFLDEGAPANHGGGPPLD